MKQLNVRMKVKVKKFQQPNSQNTKDSLLNIYN